MINENYDINFQNQQQEISPPQQLNIQYQQQNIQHQISPQQQQYNQQTIQHLISPQPIQPQLSIPIEYQYQYQQFHPYVQVQQQEQHFYTNSIQQQQTQTQYQPLFNSDLNQEDDEENEGEEEKEEENEGSEEDDSTEESQRDNNSSEHFEIQSESDDDYSDMEFNHINNEQQENDEIQMKEIENQLKKNLPSKTNITSIMIKNQQEINKNYSNRYGVDSKTTKKILKFYKKHYKDKIKLEDIEMFLDYLATYNSQDKVAQDYNLTPKTFRKRFSLILNNLFLVIPTIDLNERFNSKISFQIDGQYCFSIVDTFFVDGTKPRTDFYKKKLFSGKHQKYGYKFQVIITLDGNKLLDISGPWSGSVHDYNIALNSKIIEKFQLTSFECVLGDKAYYRDQSNRAFISLYKRPKDCEEIPEIKQYNKTLSRYRLKIIKYFNRLRKFNVLTQIYRGDIDDLFKIFKILNFFLSLEHSSLVDQ